MRVGSSKFDGSRDSDDNLQLGIYSTVPRFLHCSPLFVTRLFGWTDSLRFSLAFSFFFQYLGDFENTEMG